MDGQTVHSGPRKPTLMTVPSQGPWASQGREAGSPTRPGSPAQEENDSLQGVMA